MKTIAEIIYIVRFFGRHLGIQLAPLCEIQILSSVEFCDSGDIISALNRVILTTGNQDTVGRGYGKHANRVENEWRERNCPSLWLSAEG